MPISIALSMTVLFYGLMTTVPIESVALKLSPGLKSSKSCDSLLHFGGELSHPWWGGAA